MNKQTNPKNKIVIAISIVVLMTILMSTSAVQGQTIRNDYSAVTTQTGYLHTSPDNDTANIFYFIPPYTQLTVEHISQDNKFYFVRWNFSETMEPMYGWVEVESIALKSK